jgi:mannosyltransferase OCH1-like enzyme
MALDGKFDRKYIRERAVKMFDMYNLAHNYEYVFKTVLDVFNGKNGWYSPDTHIKSLLPTDEIPLKIWQTWETKDLPPKMKECVDKLKTQHPRFEHTLFDNNDMRIFIERHFPNEVLLAYDSLIPGAFKADLWRLCVLYISGGVYMDIKLQFCNGYTLNDFTDKEYFANAPYIEDNKKRIGIYNAFMISKKDNPILLKSILHIVLNIIKNYYGNTPFYMTGPILIGKIVETSSIRPNLSLLHYGPKNKETIKLNEVIIADHYPEYRSEQKQLKKPYYSTIWEKKQVYSKDQLSLIHIYNNNNFSKEFIALLKIVDCNNIDEITKFSGIMF